MRQPLTGIRAGLELVARRLGQQVTRLDDWALITAQVDRMERSSAPTRTSCTPSATRRRPSPSSRWWSAR
jgi:hypothetical protein